MEFNGLLNVCCDYVKRGTGGDATRQVRCVRREVRTCILNYDCKLSQRGLRGNPA